MLCLTRKRGEAIVIAHGFATIRVLDIRGDRVQLGIEAPADVTVNREEVESRPREDDRTS